MQDGRLPGVDVYDTKALFETAPQEVAPAEQVLDDMSVGRRAYGLYALIGHLQQSVVGAYPCLPSSVGDDGVDWLYAPLLRLPVGPAV